MLCCICSSVLRYDQRFLLQLFNYSCCSLCMWVHLAASFESLQQLSEDSGAGKYAVLAEPLLEIVFYFIFLPNIHIFPVYILKILKDH